MKTRELIMVVATAIVVITLCSTSSPMHSINPWVDANIFFTVGKSMLHGLMPYRDLIEQKGPILYMMHAVAAAVSFRTFTGVWLIEIIAAACFLWWSFQTVRLYHAQASICLIPFMAAVVYSSKGFVQGDSAEEFSLPLLAYGFCTGLRAIKERRQLTVREYLGVGIAASIIFWIKFNVLGMYVGWLLFLAVRAWKRGEMPALLRGVGIMAAAFAVPSALVIAFFSAKGAQGDLVQIYFYNNIFVYRQPTPPLGWLSHCCKFVLNTMPVTTVALAGALWSMAKGERVICLYTLLCAAATLILALGGGVAHMYYAFTLGTFFPISLAVFTRNHGGNLPRWAKCGVAAFGAVYAFLMSGNATIKRNNNTMQSHFAEIINRKPNATLLNYATLDLGVYTATGIVPDCKAFCQINMNVEKWQSMQEDWLRNGSADFVVTNDKEVDSPLYQLACADTTGHFVDGEYVMHIYRLYQRRCR